MASINISEEEFAPVAGAAMSAWERGNFDEARVLDKLARKINASLSNSSVPTPLGRVSKPLNWKDVPSIIPIEGETR